MESSGFPIEAEPDRIGIVMGTAMDGVTTVAQTQAAFDAGHRVGPRFVPMTIGNIAAAQIAIAHGIHGPSMTLNTACSAGGDAMMVAAMLLRPARRTQYLRSAGRASCARLWCPACRRPRRFPAATTTLSMPAARSTSTGTVLSSAKAAARC